QVGGACRVRQLRGNRVYSAERAGHPLCILPGRLRAGLQFLLHRQAGLQQRPDRRRDHRPGWIANKSFGTVPAKIDRAITNVVMMGMGEPLLNFDNVVDAMTLMMDDLGYGISKRKVTLSTSGVVPMIEKLGEVTDVALALSLHAPNDELRNQLVPLNKK